MVWKEDQTVTTFPYANVSFGMVSLFFDSMKSARNEGVADKKVEV